MAEARAAENGAGHGMVLCRDNRDGVKRGDAANAVVSVVIVAHRLQVNGRRREKYARDECQLNNMAAKNANGMALL